MHALMMIRGVSSLSVCLDPVPNIPNKVLLKRSVISLPIAWYSVVRYFLIPANFSIPWMCLLSKKFPDLNVCSWDIRS